MKKRSYVLGLTLTFLYLSGVKGQYPVMDVVVNRIIQKYQTSTCEQLFLQRAQEKQPGPEEQKAIALLHGDPQMREAFIDKIAAPIANKMFACGMTP